MTRLATPTPATFRAAHGDPTGWTAAEFDDYLTACDATAATTDSPDNENRAQQNPQGWGA